MNEETKKEFLNTVKDIDIADNIKNPIIAFIETYDGTNEIEFISLVYHIVFLLSAIRELAVKADAYDALEKNYSDFSGSLDSMKDRYEALMEGKLPIEKIFSSMPEENLEE